MVGPRGVSWYKFPNISPQVRWAWEGSRGIQEVRLTGFVGLDDCAVRKRAWSVYTIPYRPMVDCTQQLIVYLHLDAELVMMGWVQSGEIVTYKMQGGEP